MKWIALTVAMAACTTSSETSTTSNGGGCSTTGGDWSFGDGDDDGGGWGGGGGGGGGGSGSDERACPEGPSTISFAGTIVGPLFAGGLSGPETQVGGTQTFTLYVAHDTGSAVIDVPFDAVGDGVGFIVDSIDGPRVTVRALGGDGYVLVRDLDGNQLGCAELASGDATAVRAETVNSLFIDDAHGVVYAPGDQLVGIAYVDATGSRVADGGATVVAEDGTARDWQSIQLPAATVGVHRISATLSTGTTLMMDAEVVDHVDAIDIPDLAELQPGTVLACFDARNAGRVVEGADYHVTANGIEVPRDAWFGANCFDLSIAAGETSVALVVTALDGRAEATRPVTGLRAVPAELVSRAKQLRATRRLVLDARQ